MRGCWGDDNVDIDNRNNNNNFTCALKVMTLHTIKSSTERRDHKKTLRKLILVSYHFSHSRILQRF